MSDHEDDVQEQMPEQGTDVEKMTKLLRKAETVLQHRTDRVVLVLERCLDNTNYLGALRTAEILGGLIFLAP